MPGLDTSNPAAIGLLISAVARGANSVNVMNGATGTLAGTPTAALRGDIGPIQFSLTSAVGTRFTVPTTAFNTKTIAAISYSAAANTGNLNDICGDSTGAGAGSGILYSYVGTQSICIRWGAAAVQGDPSDLPAGAPFTTNVPYFVVATMNTVGCYLCVRNLITGALFGPTKIGPATPVITAGTGTFYLGTRGDNAANRQLNGGISAAMMSTAFLTFKDMVAWSEDPWSFWYPRKSIALVVGAAGPTSWTAAAVGAGAGNAAVTARTTDVGIAVGAGAGVGSVTAVTTDVGVAVGAGAAVGNVTAVTTDKAIAVGAGTGAGVVDGLPQSFASAAAAGAGVGTVTAVTTDKAIVVGAGAGVGAVTAVTTDVGIAIGAGAGVGSVDGLPQSFASVVAAGAGVGAVTAVTTDLAIAIAAGSGVGVVSAPPLGADSTAVAAGAGVGAVTALTTDVGLAVAAGQGVGAATALTTDLAIAIAAGNGVGAVGLGNIVLPTAAFGAGAGAAAARAVTTDMAAALATAAGAGAVIAFAQQRAAALGAGFGFANVTAFGGTAGLISSGDEYLFRDGRRGRR